MIVPLGPLVAARFWLCWMTKATVTIVVSVLNVRGTMLRTQIRARSSPGCLGPSGPAIGRLVTGSLARRSSLMSSGTGDKVKGRLKEAAGALAGDEKLKNEGRADQLVGKVKNTVERVVDKAKELVKDS